MMQDALLLPLPLSLLLLQPPSLLLLLVLCVSPCCSPSLLPG